MPLERPLIAIVGPTAAGKTELALHLATTFAAEIVNYDSIQMYRRLDIGSAKPGTDARSRVHHHLIDCLDLDQAFNAGLFARMATDVLQKLREACTLPILVGGTGFYLRALLDGLFPAPSADPDLRTRLSAAVARHESVLHRFLRRFDPAAAGSIHPNDIQKSTRAVEIAITSRVPATKAQTVPRQGLWGYRVLKLGVAPSRAELHNRVNLRAQHMFDSGLVEETKAVLDEGYSPMLPALASLGYKQAVRLILGQATRDDSVRECQARTRQYVKRQMTWFRRETDVQWILGFGSDTAVQQRAVNITSEFLSHL